MGQGDAIAWVLLATVLACMALRWLRTRMLLAHRSALRDEPYNREEAAPFLRNA